MSNWLTRGLLCLTTLYGASKASATATVYLELPPVQPLPGQFFDVRIVADLSNPALGWGLDFTIANDLIAEVTGVDIGDAWLPTATTDGDGLGGIGFPDAIQGDGVLLATITVQALAPGATELILSDDHPNDLTEGIALDPAGFESVDYVPAVLTVAPEPTSLLMLSLLALGTIQRGRAQVVISPKRTSAAARCIEEP